MILTFNLAALLNVLLAAAGLWATLPETRWFRQLKKSWPATIPGHFLIPR